MSALFRLDDGSFEKFTRIVKKEDESDEYKVNEKVIDAFSFYSFLFHRRLDEEGSFSEPIDYNAKCLLS